MSLEHLTISGGALDQSQLSWLDEKVAQNGRSVYFMYGQTEASGRMTVLPPNLLKIKRGSVGLPVPQGHVSCDFDGSIIYSGPNVMLGYAKCRDDLSKGDENQGRLDTGDLGYLDAEGFLTITGRKSRVCKILGMRVSLDEVQAHIRDQGFDVSIIADDPDKVTVCHTGLSDPSIEAISAEFASIMRLPRTVLNFVRVEKLVGAATGKLLSRRTS
jgi:long-chain acyl-CoA synthetase